MVSTVIGARNNPYKSLLVLPVLGPSACWPLWKALLLHQWETVRSVCINVHPLNGRLILCCPMKERKTRQSWHIIYREDRVNVYIVILIMCSSIFSFNAINILLNQKQIRCFGSVLLKLKSLLWYKFKIIKLLAVSHLPSIFSSVDFINLTFEFEQPQGFIWFNRSY